MGGGIQIRTQRKRIERTSLALCSWHSQCISMISSRLGKIVDSSMVVRSCSLSSGLEKITWRTLSIRTWACSVANSSGSERETGSVVKNTWLSVQPPNRVLGPPVLHTVDDFLPFCLFLAETRQTFGAGQLSPVGRVLLKLQEAGLHLLQLRGRARRGVAQAFGKQNWPFGTERYIKGEKTSFRQSKQLRKI